MKKNHRSVASRASGRRNKPYIVLSAAPHDVCWPDKLPAEEAAIKESEVGASGVSWSRRSQTEHLTSDNVPDLPSNPRSKPHLAVPRESRVSAESISWGRLAFVVVVLLTMGFAIWTRLEVDDVVTQLNAMLDRIPRQPSGLNDIASASGHSLESHQVAWALQPLTNTPATIETRYATTDKPSFETISFRRALSDLPRPTVAAVPHSADPIGTNPLASASLSMADAEHMLANAQREGRPVLIVFHNESSNASGYHRWLCFVSQRTPERALLREVLREYVIVPLPRAEMPEFCQHLGRTAFKSSSGRAPWLVVARWNGKPLAVLSDDESQEDLLRKLARGWVRAAQDYPPSLDRLCVAKQLLVKIDPSLARDLQDLIDRRRLPFQENKPLEFAGASHLR